MSAYCLPTEDLSVLHRIFKFARSKKVSLYIVGGYTRDSILNRPRVNPDIDFCLRRHAIAFGRALAEDLRTGFVVLDKEHGACRLVKKTAHAVYTLDFTDFRGATLEEDLRHRDFTINTLAISLQAVVRNGLQPDSMLDLCGAKRDLRAKVVRSLNRATFDEDPLRILRAFSFSSLLGFRIDAQTLRLITAKKNKLGAVSFERVRDELFKIFVGPRSGEYLKTLDRLNVLPIIFPEIKMMRGVAQGPYHHLDVWQHTLETLHQLDLLFLQLRRQASLQAYLDEVISSERTRGSLLKLGAILHDMGKPKALRRLKGKLIFHGHERIGLSYTHDIAKRLKLSNDELMVLRTVVLWHLRPGYLADNETLTARARFRYFRDTGTEAVGILLLSIADQRATKGKFTTKQSRRHHEATCMSLVKEYFKKKKEKKPVRLINGDDILRQFKVPSSPLIGRILSAVEEAQAIGKISSKQQALAIARKFFGAHKSREKD